jgi:hypothetical protein
MHCSPRWFYDMAVVRSDDSEEPVKSEAMVRLLLSHIKETEPEKWAEIQDAGIANGRAQARPDPDRHWDEVA